MPFLLLTVLGEKKVKAECFNIMMIESQQTSFCLISNKENRIIRAWWHLSSITSTVCCYFEMFLMNLPFLLLLWQKVHTKCQATACFRTPQSFSYFSFHFSAAKLNGIKVPCLHTFPTHKMRTNGTMTMNSLPQQQLSLLSSPTHKLPLLLHV